VRIVDKSFDELLQNRKAQKGNVIPLLQKTQELRGYLDQEEMVAIAEVTGKSPAEIYGVATFYAQFYLEPQGKHRIRVCRGTACHVRGSGQIRQLIESKLGVEEGETTDDLLFTLETVACVGCCALSPVMMVDDTYYGRMTPEKADTVLNTYMAKASENA
jgi:NADH-quinone oxidoreductase subunit E